MEYFTLDYGILLPVLNTFAVNYGEYSQGASYKINDAKALKNLYHNYSIIWRFQIASQ